MFFNQLVAGDVLHRWKDGVWHLGIFMGDGTVLHNSPGEGERRTSLRIYAAGQQIWAWQPESAGRAEIMRRAWDIVRNPKPYDHLTRNCEHTVFEAVKGEAKSPTVRKVLVGLGITAALVLCVVYSKEIAKALRSVRK